MSEELFRIYLDPNELADDGYPLQWAYGVATWDELHAARPDAPRIPDVIRERAGHRCQRCNHPFVVGSTPGKWSPCTTECTHGGPIRMREAGEQGEWSTHVLIPTTAGEALYDFGPENHPVVRYAVEALWRVLTVHHLNGAKHDCRWWNLVALCQRCHLTIQGKVHLTRPWIFPHKPWFRLHAAGFYASVKYEDAEPSRDWVIEHADELLAEHEIQGALL